MTTKTESIRSLSFTENALTYMHPDSPETLSESALEAKIQLEFSY